jgi:hypothetical protein
MFAMFAFYKKLVICVCCLTLAGAASAQTPAVVEGTPLPASKGKAGPVTDIFQGKPTEWEHAFAHLRHNSLDEYSVADARGMLLTYKISELLIGTNLSKPKDASDASLLYIALITNKFEQAGWEYVQTSTIKEATGDGTILAFRRRRK